MNKIERIHKPTREDFERNFLYLLKPCIITGAMDNWKALSVWKLDYFKSIIGDKVVLCRESDSDYFVNYNGCHITKQKNIKMSAFIEWLMWEQSPELWDWLKPKISSKRYYLTSLNIPTYFPELLQDIEFPEYFDRQLLEYTKLWMGCGNNRVNLHYDTSYNLYAQIIGNKRWVIFPPEQSSLLYAYPFYTSFYWCSQVNVNDPDLKKFPKFAEVKPLEFMTEPGEMLFLPPGWWHSPIGVGLNIAVNFWWRMPLKEVISKGWVLPRVARCHLIANRVTIAPFLKLRHQLFSKFRFTHES